MKRFAILLFVATGAFAETVSVGSLPIGQQFFVGTASTIIDTSRPATGPGSVTTATIEWGNDAGTPCANAFTIRFYRRYPTTVGIVDERGPFAAHRGLVTVALDPPVQLQGGELIAVHRLAVNAACGQPVSAAHDRTGSMLHGEADEGFTRIETLVPEDGYTLVAIASDTPAVRTAIIPAVASAAGKGGSFFRTSVQMTNPTDLPIRGTLVFRRQGVPGSGGDPSLDYALAPRQTVTYDDVLAAMGQSGLGSLDLYAASSYAPILAAHVYNDAGDGGTAGFDEAAVRVPAFQPFQASMVGFLAVPKDLTNFRFNIGVRTLQAMQITFALFDASGKTVATTTKNYPADYFEQKPAAELFGRADIPAGGSIEAFAVVPFLQQFFVLYGATTDNRTQNPGIRFAGVN